MHIQWAHRQLKSNKQSGILVCTHFEIPRPWVVYPYMMHQYEGSSQNTCIWRPAPSIRQCCIDSADGHALSHWWWTVGQRFKQLQKTGLEDTEITKALLEQLDLIEEILEEVVPKPTRGQMRDYLFFREDLGLPDYEIVQSRKNRIPTFAKILGLETWPCTKDKLKKSWANMALQHHPDRGGNPAKFRLCQQAYQKALRTFEE